MLESLVARRQKASAAGTPLPAAAPMRGGALRIVHVARQCRPSVGGLEAVVESLARHQCAQGHDVTIVTLDRVFSDPATRLPRTEVMDGVVIRRIPFWGSRRYPIAPGVLRHIRGASVVHVHGIDFFFDFLALTGFLHHRTLVATTHGGFFHTAFAGTLKRLWFAAVTRLASRRYGAVVACSDQDAERFAALDHPTLVTIHNGVELDRLGRPHAAAGDEMLYFGRLSPNKDLDGLLAWFAAVRRRAPAWRLTIAGRPDGITIADLVDRVSIYGLAGHVRIVNAPGDARLAELVAEASVYVSASRYEGFGLAPVEAAAAGLVPVLRDIPAFRTLVDRLGSGILTDFACDEAAVDDTLARIAAQRRGNGPSEEAIASFGWPGAAERYDRVYRHCLGSDLRHIGPVAIQVTDSASVVDTFDRHVERHQPLTIAFCNAHTVNVAGHDAAMAAALRGAMVVNDGVGVDLASRLLFGTPFPENLNGTDLTPRILQRTAHDLRVFLIGAAPGVAEQAAEALHREFPRHSIVGVHHGYFDDAEAELIVEEIRRQHPDLVLLGMGHPRQELWAARYAGRVPGVTMCVGAFIDRMGGRVNRAPAWMRRARAEWVYRLAREPRRLAGRYLIGNAAFLTSVLRQHGNGSLELR